MADLGSSVVYGDLVVTGKIKGKGAGGAGGIVKTGVDLGIAFSPDGNSSVGSTYYKATAANTAYANIITADFEDLVYGSYAIMLRTAIASIASAANLVKIEAYHVVGSTETLLNTAYMKPSDYVTAGSWDTFGFVAKFKGTQGTSAPILRIKISIVSNTVANQFYFDYLAVSPAYASIYSLPTT